MTWGIFIVKHQIHQNHYYMCYTERNITMKIKYGIAHSSEQNTAQRRTRIREVYSSEKHTARRKTQLGEEHSSEKNTVREEHSSEKHTVQIRDSRKFESPRRIKRRVYFGCRSNLLSRTMFLYCSSVGQLSSSLHRMSCPCPRCRLSISRQNTPMALSLCRRVHYSQ